MAFDRKVSPPHINLSEDPSEDPSENSDVSFERKPYNQSKALDKARRKFATKLFWLLVFVLLAGLALITTTRFTNIAFSDAKDLFLTVFTAVLAIVSSVVGYYFGRAESSGNG